jgi:hypothetical protein
VLSNWLWRANLLIVTALLILHILTFLEMPPRRATQAKKAAKTSTAAAKASDSGPTFTPAQAKELEKLLKAQKAAEAAKEEAKKKGE